MQSELFNIATLLHVKRRSQQQFNSIVGSNIWDKQIFKEFCRIEQIKKFLSLLWFDTHRRYYINYQALD